MKIIEYIKKHGLKLSCVYDAELNRVKLKDIEKGKDYFLSKMQARTEKTRASFLSAIGSNVETAKEVVETPEQDSVDFEAMETKADLQDYALSNFGLEINSRKTRSQMIELIKKEMEDI